CRRWAVWPSALLHVLLGGLLSRLGLLHFLFLHLLLDLRLLGELDRAAGPFDHGARALAHLDFLQRNLAVELAGQDYFRDQRSVRDDALGLERREVDIR